MGTDTNYYTSLTIYTKSLGMQFTIGNAGENVDTSYVNVVDTVVIANSSYLPNLTDYANWQNAHLPKTDVAMLIDSITAFPTGFIYEAKNLPAGFISLMPAV